MLLRRATLLSVLPLALAACGGPTTPPPDGSVPTDVPVNDSPSPADAPIDAPTDAGTIESGIDAASDAACAGEQPGCVTGTAGGACGDGVMQATCVGGTWTCPSGTIDSRMCACVGRPPGSGCTCGASGWVCPDAGGRDAQAEAGPSETGAACTGRPAGCTFGTRGGPCSDALTPPTCVDGAWRCDPLQIPVTECACVGPPPRSGCRCTSEGWSC